MPRLGSAAVSQVLLSPPVRVSILPMTDKQAVFDALTRLPEDASLEEITEELRIMAAIRRGRADIASGRTKTQDEAEHLLESWATAGISR